MMAIEEITLSVPCEPGVITGTWPKQPRSDEAHAVRPEDLERLAASYLKAARIRDRLALTQRARERRQERFQVALKTLAKGMATEATRTVHERPLRLDARTRIYGTMMVLARVTSEDHLAVVGRARNTLRWALAIATVGVAGIVFTVFANGWLT